MRIKAHNGSIKNASGTHIRRRENISSEHCHFVCRHCHFICRRCRETKLSQWTGFIGVNRKTTKMDEDCMMLNCYSVCLSNLARVFWPAWSENKCAFFHNNNFIQNRIFFRVRKYFAITYEFLWSSSGFS